MINLNFKQWLEAITTSGSTGSYRNSMRPMGVKPTSYKNYQVRDLRTAPYGPYSGFRDTPGLATRLGSDFLQGMQNYYANVRDSNTLQPVRSTYDISRDFRIDSVGKLATLEIPWSKNILYKTDEQGNYLDSNGEITDIKNAIFDDPKQIKKKANEIMKKYIQKHPEIIEQLIDKNAHIDSLDYVDIDETNQKDDDGEEIIILKYAARIIRSEEQSKTGITNPNHKYNVAIKARAGN